MSQPEATYAADGGPHEDRSIDVVAVVTDGGTLARYEQDVSFGGWEASSDWWTYTPEPDAASKQLVKLGYILMEESTY